EPSAVAWDAELLTQLQEQPGEARFNARAGQLRQAFRQLDESQRQARQQPANQRGRFLEQTEKSLSRYVQAHGRVERLRRCGIRPSFVHSDGAQWITGPENLEDQVPAARQPLEDLHAPLDDGDEVVGRLAFLEDDIAALVAPEAS